MLDRIGSYATLARWLGPWASEAVAPTGVERQVVAIDGEVEVWEYRPRRGRVRGAMLVAPGLHYAGPADPRMDRFCRIMAASGLLVAAPFIRDYTALRVVPRALDDLARAFDHVRALPELPRGCRPIIFSISFGSLLALRLASARVRADQVGGLLIFGGYADWAETIRFSLTGEIDGMVHAAHDPLNQPVVFINLLDTMDGVPDDRTPLIAAWTKYVRATWGRAEYKRGTRHHAVARSLAHEVPEGMRSLFLKGCGAEPGGFELCMDALSRATDASAFLDPRPHLDGLRCPVHIVHGVDDDVIPFIQLDRLARALPSHVECKTYLTGMYGHTSTTSVAELVRNLPLMAKELWTMARMLHALVDTPRA